MDKLLRKYYYEEFSETGYPRFHRLNDGQRKAIEGSYGFAIFKVNQEARKLVSPLLHFVKSIENRFVCSRMN